VDEEKVRKVSDAVQGIRSVRLFRGDTVDRHKGRKGRAVARREEGGRNAHHQSHPINKQQNHRPSQSKLPSNLLQHPPERQYRPRKERRRRKDSSKAVFRDVGAVALFPPLAEGVVGELTAEFGGDYVAET
jgi:hypothetical protein